MPIFYQTHGLTPLQKCQFFDYRYVKIFSIVQKALFSMYNIIKLYILAVWKE